jgi:integrase
VSPTLYKRNLEQINLLRQDELKRLFAAIRSKRDCALFLLAYRHGLRAAEVGLLHVSDVD